MKGQQKVYGIELIPPKFVENEHGYELVSNDGTMRLFLRRIIMMEGSMERDFYSTVMWIKEEGVWVQVSNTQNYRTKEEFINAISQAEDFTEAIAEFNNQNNNEL